MRKLLIKILFRLLEDKSYKNIDDVRINKWLASQYQIQGFQDYFRKRDLQLLKTMGLGIEGKNYWIRVGQRMELLTLLSRVKEEYGKNKKVGTKKLKKKTK